MPKAPITNIIFATMTLGYRGYGARVHDAPSADAMLGTFSEFGHDQIDTCADYGDGSCEQMLGDLRAAERFGIATRIHPQNFHGHEPETPEMRAVLLCFNVSRSCGASYGLAHAASIACTALAT
jgi:aflatoxin B1 aldehyde reductase